MTLETILCDFMWVSRERRREQDSTEPENNFYKVFDSQGTDGIHFPCSFLQ